MHIGIANYPQLSLLSAYRVQALATGLLCYSLCLSIYSSCPSYSILSSLKLSSVLLARVENVEVENALPPNEAGRSG